MSVSEPTAVFAVGEFAGAVGDKRRSADRKSFVPALEFCIILFFITQARFIRGAKHRLVSDSPPYKMAAIQK